MGSKVLVGAIVGAFFVWGGVFALVRQSGATLALAAPARVHKRLTECIGAEDLERPQREAAAAEPQPEDDTEEASPSPPLTAENIASLIADLRDDDVPYNAESALWSLTYAGPEVIAPLEAALQSRDAQQRRLVGYLLGGKSEAPASPALAHVLLESLEEREQQPRVTPDLHENAFRRFSRDRALFGMVENRIALGLNSADPCARIETAFLLAKQHSELARRRVLAALIGALEDNEVRGDARLGLRGLVCLGEEAREALENAWPGRDEQQGALIAHMLSKLSPKHPGAHALGTRTLAHMGFPAGDPLRIQEPEL